MTRWFIKTLGGSLYQSCLTEAFSCSRYSLHRCSSNQLMDDGSDIYHMLFKRSGRMAKQVSNTRYAILYQEIPYNECSYSRGSLFQQSAPGWLIGYSPVLLQRTWRTGRWVIKTLCGSLYQKRISEVLPGNIATSPVLGLSMLRIHAVLFIKLYNLRCYFFIAALIA